jgi:inner membrane protein
MATFRSSFLLKIFLLGLLWIGLMIPLWQVGDLISERQARQQGVTSEVGASWGGRQTVVGPILHVPYRVPAVDHLGNVIWSNHWAHFLPDKLEVDGAIAPEKRRRGIFEAVVYRSDLDLRAEFRAPDLMQAIREPRAEPIWAAAVLTIGISDLRGLRSSLDLKWQGQDLELAPTEDPAELGVPVLGARVPLGASQRYQLELKLAVNGSENLLFAPLGRETKVKLTSSWPDPSFSGKFLPDTRKVAATGFEATWQIPFFAREYPQSFGSQKPEILASAFGVELFLAVDSYQKTERSRKYASLFILLTFLTFLLFEVFEGRSLHGVQYLLVGFAMCLFFLLLLSLSEHMVFGQAYAVAAGATSALIAFYARAVLGSQRGAVILAGVLALLYSLLFILLRSQDFALLIGSVALFAVLATVMYATRKVNWAGSIDTSEPALEGREDF